jgi:hypothetical protein
MVFCTRPLRDEEHLRRALWTGLGFRARDFWKAGRRRELSVANLFDDARRAASTASPMMRRPPPTPRYRRRLPERSRLA